MNTVHTCPWHTGTFSAYIRKGEGFGYQYHVSTGKTRQQAMKNAAKELRRLAKLFDERAKDEKAD